MAEEFDLNWDDPRSPYWMFYEFEAIDLIKTAKSIGIEPDKVDDFIELFNGENTEEVRKCAHELLPFYLAIWDTMAVDWESGTG